MGNLKCTVFTDNTHTYIDFIFSFSVHLFICVNLCSVHLHWFEGDFIKIEKHKLNKDQIDCDWLGNRKLLIINTTTTGITILGENNLTLEVENTYLTPDIDTENLLKSRTHFENQSRK